MPSRINENLFSKPPIDVTKSVNLTSNCNLIDDEYLEKQKFFEKMTVLIEEILKIIRNKSKQTNKKTNTIK